MQAMVKSRKFSKCYSKNFKIFNLCRPLQCRATPSEEQWRRGVIFSPIWECEEEKGVNRKIPSRNAKQLWFTDKRYLLINEIPSKGFPLLPVEVIKSRHAGIWFNILRVLDVIHYPLLSSSFWYRGQIRPQHPANSVKTMAFNTSLLFIKQFPVVHATRKQER